MLKTYRCVQCSRHSLVESLNESTMEDIKQLSENTRNEITPIENIEIRNYDDGYYYVCPYCGGKLL